MTHRRLGVCRHSSDGIFSKPHWTASVPKRAALYKAVQCQVGQLMGKWRKHGFPSASGPCVDCGSTKTVCHDHRSYDDPMVVDVVCTSCNMKRGAAHYSVFDPELGAFVDGPVDAKLLQAIAQRAA